MPGHPDGQNYAIWRGPDFLATNAFNLSASNPCNVQGQVTNYASLIVNVFANNPGGIAVQVEFWTDSTLSIATLQLNWQLPQGVGLNVILPCLGNFVTAIITTPDVAATTSPISILPTNSVVQKPQYQTPGNRINSLTTSIPASTTVIIPMTWIAAGEAHVFFKDIAASGKLQYQVIEVAQNKTRAGTLFENDIPVTISQADMATSDVSIGMSITNTDAAAAHNAQYYLTVDAR